MCSLRKGSQTTEEDTQLGSGRCMEKAGFALSDGSERPWLEFLLVLSLVLSPWFLPRYCHLSPRTHQLPGPLLAGPGSTLMPKASAWAPSGGCWPSGPTRELTATPEGVPGSQTSRVPRGSLCSPGFGAQFLIKRQRDGGPNQLFSSSFLKGVRFLPSVHTALTTIKTV